MSDNSEADLLYGTAQIGAFLGLSPRQAKHRAARGELPTFKMGRQVCASRSKLRNWLAERSGAADRGDPGHRAA